MGRVSGKKQKDYNQIIYDIVDKLKKKNDALDQKPVQAIDNDKLQEELDQLFPSFEEDNEYEDEGKEVSDQVFAGSNDNVSDRPNANVNVIDTMGGPDLSVKHNNNLNEDDELLAELEALEMMD